MSYEKKIKDLMARLAAMSPEPPPYPEETPMAQQQPEKKTHPALVFAAAVAVVALLAIPLLLLTGDDTPVGAGSTTTTSVTTTSLAPGTSTAPPTTTSPTTSEPTTTVPAATTWTGTLFLYQSPQNSFLGNPALVPISVELTDQSGQLTSGDLFTEALAAIGPEMPELPSEASLVNAVPPGVQIVSLGTTTVRGNQIWAADMNEAFLDGAGGLLADYTMLNQLIYTITYGEDSDADVLFSVGGEPVTAFGSEGLDLSQPVDYESFVDELAPIFLTEPLVQVGDAYQVVGAANVFEASLIVQVVDGAGETLHEEPVTATCGSGCWGTFATEIDPALISGGDTYVRLLTYSAEDGSPSDVVTVPIPGGDVWAITVG
ncbi:MAG TPA: Gmad2 immunoglobulin-like domain-containing protein [Acidimicrobiia bacterium]|nr:Gmad2 immunoglobulin-like domain-containing protein [Acidimicrobiia bacterium]